VPELVLELPQAQVLGELVMEPINKALQEENGRLKTEIEVLKERESSKNKEMLLKQELVDEYKTRAKNVEEENQRAKDEIQRSRDEIQRFRDEVSSLKEKEIRLTVENEYLKHREEELRSERNAERARLTVENEYLKRKEEEFSTERAERTAERAMLQTMILSLMNGMEDGKRKRNDDDEAE
jgi:FtsZ-binding cell division protein ZapB